MNKRAGIIIGALSVLCICVRLTGESIHILCGIGLVVVTLVHIMSNKNRMIYVPKKIRVVDWIIIIGLAITFITGMLLHPLHNVVFVKVIHKLSSVIFIVGCIVHIIQHHNLARKERD